MAHRCLDNQGPNVLYYMVAIFGLKFSYILWGFLILKNYYVVYTQCIVITKNYTPICWTGNLTEWCMHTCSRVMLITYLYSHVQFVKFSRAWNKSQPLAIFQPIFTIWPSKSNLLCQIYSAFPIGKPLTVYRNVPAFNP